MYYEERIIDGNLCYRLDSDKGWIKIGYKALVTKYLHLKREKDLLKRRSESHNTSVRDIEAY